MDEGLESVRVNVSSGSSTESEAVVMRAVPEMSPAGIVSVSPLMAVKSVAEAVSSTAIEVLYSTVTSAEVE